MSPRVSVVIPLYNKAPFLPRALDAVRRQTRPDWECVVVDDGSTDGGGQIVARTSDPRIRLVTQENHGPGRARNRGVAESRSDLLAFLDADDSWDADYLATQLEPLERDAALAAAVCAHRRTGGGTSTKSPWPEVTRGAWRLPVDMDPADVKRAVDFMHTSATVVRRSAFEQCHGFHEKNRCTYGEDTYLWIQILFGYTLWLEPREKLDYHVDASVLGIGRPTPYPPWPMLLEPDPITGACPPSHLPLLERTLAYYALIAARRSYRAGNRREAVQVLKVVRRRVLPNNRAASRQLGRELTRIRIRWPLHRMKTLARTVPGSAGNGPLPKSD